jgi:hypothetical protein
VGHISRIHALGHNINRKKFSQSREVDDAFFGTWPETAPVANMLSRPEEVHSASAIGKVLEPFLKRYRRVPHQTFRLGTLDETVFYLHPDG